MDGKHVLFLELWNSELVGVEAAWATQLGDAAAVVDGKHALFFELEISELIDVDQAWVTQMLS